MASIIWTENLNRIFISGKEKIYALKDVNVNIEEKKLTILKGRSGSGKTTLINLMGVLDKPSEGKVLFRGKEISKFDEKSVDELHRKHMGFVFQSFALISIMSAYENVDFTLRLQHMGAINRKNRAEECLDMVGLRKRMNHRPSEMSGGEQQRTAIARAIAHRPQIIFADEPTAELDSKMAFQIMKIFRELVDIEGITVIMTTHDPNILNLSDHIITLEDGEVIEST